MVHKFFIKRNRVPACPSSFSPLARRTLVIFLGIFCAALGWGWLGQTSSSEEMYGAGLRGEDFFGAAKSVGGWPWWSPNFLFGHSLSLFSVSLLPLLVFKVLVWSMSLWVPVIMASKLLGLLTIFFAGLAMYGLSRRLLLGGWTAAFTAVLYVTCAQFVLRIAMLEHLSTAACMVFAPLILLGMLRCEERQAWRSSCLLALSVAAMAMCYLKILLLFLPAGAVFFLWRFAGGSSESRSNLFWGCLRGALLTMPLVLFAMVPLLRESRFLAVFELEPFAGWQQNYSFFSAITWVDWGNVLTQGTAIPALSPAKHASVEFYLGLLVLAGVFAPLFLGRSRDAWRALPAWDVLRLFASLLLLATWLSSGPRSILQSHFVYLGGAAGCPDFSIALVWLMFVAQGGLIYLLWGHGTIRIALALATMAVFFLVPGFKILELIPFYGDIRAPSAVWTAFGSLSAVLAAGAGWSLLAKFAPTAKSRLGIAAIVLVLLALDVSFLHRAFFREGLPGKTFSDYAEAQAFLSKSPLAGRVHAISGRYFLLTTPADSGRGLSTEALLRHFQLRWIRYMEAGSMMSPETTRAYYDLFGISHILIDRLDPDLPKDYQEKFKALFPTVFENEGFTILENSSTLYPAFAAKDVIHAAKDIFQNPGEVLLLGRGGLIAVEDATGPSVGKMELTGDPPIPDRAGLEKVVDLRKLALSRPRTADYHSFDVEGLQEGDKPGLAVVTEAYHPDWKAWQGGAELPVKRAVGALLAVEIQQPGTVTFRFTPPWYYDFLMWAALGSWLAVAVLFFLMRVGWAPESWRSAWYGGTDAGPRS